MDPTRFDRISKLLTDRRLSRREAMTSTATAITGAAAVATIPLIGYAEHATPDASPVASPVPTDRDHASFLFVQSASSATYVEGEHPTYRLTLKGHTGGTVYFSDRPERIFGEAPTQNFLDGLGFSAENPPNAAIVTNGTGGASDVLVVELANPAFDATSGDLSYDVTPLENYTGEGLAFAAANQQDLVLSPDLGSTSLFIDDCPDTTASCTISSGGCTGEIHIGTCWSWSDWQCHPCASFADMDAQCNAMYDKCNGECVAVPFEQCG
jgi:hypothetical protein